MNLYVQECERFSNAWPMAERVRKATPGEALQYALTCQTCEGSGKNPVRPELDDDGDTIPTMQVGATCPDCIDGIPRWAMETGARASAGLVSDEEIVKAVLVALRDREETE